MAVAALDMTGGGSPSGGGAPTGGGAPAARPAGATGSYPGAGAPAGARPGSYPGTMKRDSTAAPTDSTRRPTGYPGSPRPTGYPGQRPATAQPADSTGREGGSQPHPVAGQHAFAGHYHAGRHHARRQPRRPAVASPWAGKSSMPGQLVRHAAFWAFPVRTFPSFRHHGTGRPGYGLTFVRSLLSAPAYA